MKMQVILSRARLNVQDEITCAFQSAGSCKGLLSL
jgi:hypothetical protein